jgi:hypothetical protein
LKNPALSFEFKHISKKKSQKKLQNKKKVFTFAPHLRENATKKEMVW